MSDVQAKHLIVNADDFGLSGDTNAGIIEAHERGIVTSASFMVRGAGAGSAAEYARTRGATLSVGLHVDLGEWAFRDGQWVTLYQVVPPDDAAAVTREVDRQLQIFHELLGREPTHLDSHQHVHRNEPVRSILTERSGRLNIPLRHFAPRVRYCGDFYGQGGKGEPYGEAITVESLIGILSRLEEGVTELCCHPGLDTRLHSMYLRERAIEVQSLCDPRVRAALESANISLTHFGMR